MIIDALRVVGQTFGMRFVTLIDHDGDRHVRRVKWRGSRAFASRLLPGIRDVWLLDGGELENGAYVQRWEPYEPFAPRAMPDPGRKD